MRAFWFLMLAVVLSAGALSTIACKKEEAGQEEVTTTAAEAQPVSLVVEIDQLAGTPDFLKSTEIDAEAVLQDIFGAAGISLTLEASDLELPPASPMSERDLAAWRHDHQNVPRGTAPVIYCLIAFEGPQSDLRGVLFATDTRDAIAVFTHDLESSSPGRRDREIVRRLAHEIAHALNLHHADVEPDGAFREGGSIESSSDESTVQWNLSQHSLDHFANHPQCEWLPASGSAFLFVQPGHINPQHKASEQFEPTDCEVTAQPAVIALSPADTAEPLEAGPLRLRLLSSRRALDISEPVILKAVLENQGNHPVELPSLLPENGFLTLTIHNLAEPNPRLFVPLSIRDDVNLGVLRLERGEAAAQDIKVFFGARGWAFTKPGRYLVRARYRTGVEIDAPTVGTSIELQVKTPEPQVAEAARELISDAEVGRFLLYEGGTHLAGARQKLNSFLALHGETPQAPALAAVLALEALAPPNDPATGKQPPIRLAEARTLLARVREPDLLARLPLSTFVRASLLQATRENLNNARLILAETVAAVAQSRTGIEAELVFGEQDTFPLLEKVLKRVPSARQTLQQQGLDVDSLIEQGSDERP